MWVNRGFSWQSGGKEGENGKGEEFSERKGWADRRFSSIAAHALREMPNDAAQRYAGNPRPVAPLTKAQGQAGRWKVPHHSPHDGNDVLASGWHADVSATIHGAALRKAAGFLQERSGAPRALERSDHPEEAA